MPRQPRHGPEDQDEGGDAEWNRSSDAPFRDEAVTDIGPIFPPPEERAAQEAASVSSPELALAVKPDLRSRKFCQHQRIDGGRFDGQPGERRRNVRRRKVYLGVEGGTDTLSGLGG